ncbi:alpha/beta hydrolase [Halieaceae bacterium IMCC14734]|uniref:Alpha/beta hydrolase n=1 Tax=Candidatus Litorirhabdus singularis TaxID=2518993 RepID=A0ABT3TDZ4_9GAMM|nr:alpha/beta hydrolase [Candidatus Litorirhabdus singularis]MCX2980531.1 alpha/beta hydrolase [Candidatus Litorirhabdus singularis]
MMRPFAVIPMGCRILLLLAGLRLSPGTYADSEPTDPEVGALRSQHGCELKYEYYQPRSLVPLATLILAHGFMRDLSSQRGWAQQWLDYNIATVVVSFCNSTVFNGHHQRNADDLITVREHLSIESTVYAGFSAGGLASYLAALRDEAAIGYLGLDSVDSGKLAINEPAELDVPALFMLAPASSCNARNNIMPTIERHGYAIEVYPNARHCHFESPFDPRCGWICGKSKADVVAVQTQIFDSATAWILATVEAERRTFNQ